MISEHFPKSLRDVHIKISDTVEDIISDKEIIDLTCFEKIVQKIIEALAYLDHKGIMHSTLVFIKETLTLKNLFLN